MRAVRIASWILVFVAIGSAAAAWFTPREIEPGDAQRVALGALDAAGIEGGEVNEPIVDGVHVPDPDPDGEGDTDPESSVEPKDAWVVFVDVDDDRLEFRVDKEAGELLYVDDLVGPDKSERFFTTEQWKIVQRYTDGKLSSWVGRNAMGSMAAVLIVGAGFVLAKRSHLVGGDSI